MARLGAAAMVLGLLFPAGGCSDRGPAPRREPSAETESLHRSLPAGQRVLVDRVLAFYAQVRTVDELKACLQNSGVIFTELPPTTLNSEEGALSIFLNDTLHSLVIEFDAKTRDLMGYCITVNWG